MKAALQTQLTAMKEYFDRSTRVLAEKDSNYCPVPGMFTAAQQLAHAAQTVEWFVDGAFAESGFDMDFERIDKEVRAVTSVAAARAWMDRACEKAKSVIESHSKSDWEEKFPPNPIMGEVPRFALFFALADHTAHHRGALTVYSRQLGYVPPMPYMEM
ncbi:MAG: DinB family protein [Bryobacteraceae bacterium]